MAVSRSLLDRRFVGGVEVLLRETPRREEAGQFVVLARASNLIAVQVGEITNGGLLPT